MACAFQIENELIFFFQHLEILINAIVILVEKLLAVVINIVVKVVLGLNLVNLLLIPDWNRLAGLVHDQIGTHIFNVTGNLLAFFELLHRVPDHWNALLGDGEQEVIGKLFQHKNVVIVWLLDVGVEFGKFNEGFPGGNAGVEDKTAEWEFDIVDLIAIGDFLVDLEFLNV